MVATSQMWLFKFKLTQGKQNMKFNFSRALATFEVFKSHMWLAATVLKRTNIEKFHPLRKFCWTAQV